MVSRNPQLSPRCVLTVHCSLLLHRAFGDSIQSSMGSKQSIGTPVHSGTRWPPERFQLPSLQRSLGLNWSLPLPFHCPLPGPGPLVSLLAFHSCVGQGISDLHLPSLAVGLPSGAAGRQWMSSLHTVSCVSLTKSS
jgi:hypothetical protein